MGQGDAFSRKATLSTWPPHRWTPTTKLVEEASTSRARRSDDMVRSGFTLLLQRYVFYLDLFRTAEASRLGGFFGAVAGFLKRFLYGMCVGVGGDC